MFSRSRTRRLFGPKTRDGAAIALVLLTAAPLLSTAEAQVVRRSPANCNCQPGCLPNGSMSSSPNSSSTNPKDPNAPTDPNDPNAAANDPNNQLMNPDQVFNPQNNNLQAASNTASSAPNTIGDFFGTVPVSTSINAGALGSVHQPGGLPGPYSALGGRQKFVEHESPLPRDRVFFNYSYFDNVPLTREGNNVNRFTPGVEKTFFDGMASLTVRVPLLTTLNNDIHTMTSDGLTDTTGQLGNINIGGKLLLANTDNLALSAGVTVTLPTAPDTRIYAEDTDRLVARYKNESVHVLPFIGLVLTPTDRLFTQVIAQLDFDTRGNAVQVINGAGALETVGRANDANFAYVTWSTGYWLTKCTSRRGIEHGIAPIVELHYNRSIRDFDKLSGTTSDGQTDFGIGTNAPGGTGNREVDSFEALNITLGLHLQCTYNSTLTLGYATPLAGVNREDQFNGELRVLLNYYFGGGSFFPSVR